VTFRCFTRDFCLRYSAPQARIELDTAVNGYADSLFSTDAMSAVFSTDAALARMLAFEAALARAQGAAGLIPKRAAETIAQACAADGFDAAAIAARARSAGAPVIPLVKDLTARVAAIDPNAARYVHLGTTSQDVMDTALVLQLREAVALIDADLARIARALEALARRHADTPMLGRTLLQPASPVSFGLKAAQWCAAVRRGRRRLDAAAREAVVLQFGGAVGTLSAYADRGLALSLQSSDCRCRRHRGTRSAMA
jgi:3-carboxy-cis,cis-muconate cycloisomerase